MKAFTQSASLLIVLLVVDIVLLFSNVAFFRGCESRTASGSAGSSTSIEDLEESAGNITSDISDLTRGLDDRVDELRRLDECDRDEVSRARASIGRLKSLLYQSNANATE